MTITVYKFPDAEQPEIAAAERAVVEAAINMGTFQLLDKAGSGIEVKAAFVPLRNAVRALLRLRAEAESRT